MVKTRVGYEANPNGNLWLKDSTGFGQKMMAKMGWKEGQGLGRTEQGITEAIRVSRKRDNRGVGCSRQWAEEGSAQMDAFSAVLAGLNSQPTNSPARPEEAETSADQPMGLEETSRRSRNRLHYAKFTRGKDLSRCSDQALLSIMGPRGVLQEKETKKEEEEKEEAEAKTDNSGVRHVQSSLSTAEYFAQKMEAMRARLNASASAPDLCERKEEEPKQEEEEEAEAFSMRPTFKLGGDDSDDLEDGEISQQSASVYAAPAAIEADDADDEKLQKRRRKEERRKRRREREISKMDDCVQEEDCKDQEIARAESEEEEERERRRRKKEKRKRRRQREAEEAEEEGRDEGEESSNQQSGGEEKTVDALPSASDDEDNSKRKKKKKKKKKRKQSSESTEETVPKRQKVYPSSATMTKEEAASFAADNEEIMQYLEWSAFSTSNLGLVVGYKYGSFMRPAS